MSKHIVELKAEDIKDVVGGFVVQTTANAGAFKDPAPTLPLRTF
jgi:hypothetical protein